MQNFQVQQPLEQRQALVADTGLIQAESLQLREFPEMNQALVGDVVTVKPGHARNRLLPQGMALRATKANIAVFEAQKAQLEADNLERRNEAEKVAESLGSLAVTLVRQASDVGQLYGSVTARDIATAVTEAGCTISRGQVRLDAPIKTLGLHGLSADAWTRFSDDGYKHFFVSQAGFKYNMMDMQAAIGIHQLARIEKNWRRRQEIWKKYMQAFNELPVTLPARPEANSRHAYHLFTLLIGEDAPVDRDHFLERMTAENIGVGVHYLSIPEHPFYRETLGWRPKDWPNAMKIGRQTVSLPITMTMDDRDVDRVINTTREILEPS